MPRDAVPEPAVTERVIVRVIVFALMPGLFNGVTMVFLRERQSAGSRTRAARRTIRNPRYAPEALEARLAPGGFVPVPPSGAVEVGSFHGIPESPPLPPTDPAPPPGPYPPIGLPFPPVEPVLPG